MRRREHGPPGCETPLATAVFTAAGLHSPGQAGVYLGPLSRRGPTRARRGKARRRDARGAAGRRPAADKSKNVGVRRTAVACAAGGG